MKRTSEVGQGALRHIKYDLVAYRWDEIPVTRFLGLGEPQTARIS